MIRIRIMAFTLFLIGALFAGVQQEQNVHKYIVREAWDLLRTQYPALENADLAIPRDRLPEDVRLRGVWTDGKQAFICGYDADGHQTYILHGK